jgi:hypothetical protein
MDESTTRPKGRGKYLGLVLTIAMVGLPLWFFFIGPQMRHDRLEKHGIRAPGRLLDVEETGTVVNDSPELELTVELRRRDGVLDTAKTDFVPSLRSLHMFQPGVAVTAAYDPEDPDEITIVDLSTAPPQVISTGSSAGAVDSLTRIADSLRREVEALRER